MPRIVLLGLILLLPACSGDGSGLSFGNFMGNSFSWDSNPHRPMGDSENMQRITGRGGAAEPLLPEPGNVWPGPPPPEATLQDIEHEQNVGALPPLPAPVPGGSSTPPGLQPPLPAPAVPPSLPSPPPQGAPQAAAPTGGGVVQTQQGPAVISTGNNGLMTFTLPSGGTGRAIDNGNGTMTLISPDGAVQTVNSPRR